MKLKLEIQEGITVLVITENVESRQIPILKAGVQKLAQAGKRTLILDLSTLGPTDVAGDAVRAELRSLVDFGLEQDANVTLVSSLEGVGDFPSVVEAIAEINSPNGKLLTLEKRLSARLRRLEAQRAEGNARLQRTAAAEGELKRLRRENGDLRKTISRAETYLEKYLAARVDPYDSTTARARTETLEKTLVSVLEQEGVLPVT